MSDFQSEISESPIASMPAAGNWRKILPAGLAILGLITAVLLAGQSQLLRRRAAELQPRASTSTTFTLTVNNVAAPQAFDDVPATNQFYQFVQSVYYHGIASECGQNPLRFCPQEPILRGEMAVWLLKSIEGADYTPPAAAGNVFDDVPATNPYAGWIEELYRLGIVSGCGSSPPLYCPQDSIPREQMAMLILKSLDGSSYTPPAAAGNVFDDVPATNPYAGWIEELYRRSITVGCSENPRLYCPQNNTLREQMATFLVKAFEMALTDGNALNHP